MNDLSTQFDVVVMLTWSDWNTEPRSNRFHYATRFARELPVLFLQNQHDAKGKISVNASNVANIDLVDVAAPILFEQVNEVRTLIRQRGFRKPLFWIYDCLNYQLLLDSIPNGLRVFHATEDYFTMESPVGNWHIQLREQLRSMLKETDLVVAVTSKVLENIQVKGGYDRRALVAENGCDYQFFDKLDTKNSGTERSEPPVVIYQGGVNLRLDYDLVCMIARRMPEYEFRFFGNIEESEGVGRLRGLANVHLLGSVEPEVFGREMISATVGIVPFQQTNLMKNSLPLKVFEYVACGLPVVTIPIYALEKYLHHGDVIRFASNADDFVSAIRELAGVRNDPARIAKGKALASSNSYDARFDRVLEEIQDVASERTTSSLPISVAMLYDPASVHVGTVKEHLEAFGSHSSNSLCYLPATNTSGSHGTLEGVGPIDLSIFDAVIIHYSVRLSSPNHIVENVAVALEQFRGLKVLFIQDEYDNVELTRSLMDRFALDLVYTCVPLDERDKVYPTFRYPSTDFLSTLTGYVPESSDMDKLVMPLEQRTLAFVYRGRELPPIYGQLGREKYLIGVEALKRAAAMNLAVDIACDSESRIYGNEWYRFLASGRATLGTESGSNVFDFDGSLSREIDELIKYEPGLSFEVIWERLVRAHDGYIRMNQISPKIFEAIRLRTALVLFEGSYSNVIQPSLHYISLKKDFSNFQTVVEQVMNDDLIEAMTERAYQDVIVSGKYSYRNFVKGVDRDLKARCLRRQPLRQMYGPVFVAESDGTMRQVLPAIPLALPFSRSVLAQGVAFQHIQQQYARSSDWLSVGAARRSFTTKGLLVRYVVVVAKAVGDLVSRHRFVDQTVRVLYRLLPESFRLQVAKSRTK